MIPLMRPEQHSSIETDLKTLEKLHDMGNHAEARMIARRLLISHTLSPDEKRRIKKVIDETRTESLVLRTIIITVLLFIIVYLYLHYT